MNKRKHVWVFSSSLPITISASHITYLSYFVLELLLSGYFFLNAKYLNRQPCFFSLFFLVQEDFRVTEKPK